MAMLLLLATACTSPGDFADECPCEQMCRDYTRDMYACVNLSGDWADWWEDCMSWCTADFDTAGPEYTLRERAVDRPSRFALLSASRYKNVLSPDGIFEETIESAVVYDEATAHAVLAWKLMADAFAKRTVEALLPEHA